MALSPSFSTTRRFPNLTTQRVLSLLVGLGDRVRRERCELPELHDRPVTAVPFRSEFFESVLCRLLGRGCIDKYGCFHDPTAVPPTRVAQQVPDQAPDALPHFRTRRAFPDCHDCLGQPLPEPVTNSDKHVLDLSVPQVAEHLRPEPYALRTVTGPNPTTSRPRAVAVLSR